MTPLPYINVMNILLLLANQWLRTGKTIDIQNAKGQKLIYCPGNHDKTSCEL